MAGGARRRRAGALRRAARRCCSGTSRAGDRVLDLGCGDGAFAAALTGAGAVGHRGRRRRRGGAAGARAGAAGARSSRSPRARTLPFGEDAFDVVWAGETLEHVADVIGLLAEVRRVLRWGGTLLVTTPNLPRLGVAARGAARAPARGAPGPARRPPALLHRADARGVLRDAGFAEVAVRRERRAAVGAPRAHRRRALALPARRIVPERALQGVARDVRRAWARATAWPAASSSSWPSPWRARPACATPRGRSPGPAPSAGRGRAPGRTCPLAAAALPASSWNWARRIQVSGVAGCSWTARSSAACAASGRRGDRLDLAEGEERIDGQRVDVLRLLGERARLIDLARGERRERVVGAVDGRLRLRGRPRGDARDEQAPRRAAAMRTRDARGRGRVARGSGRGRPASPRTAAPARPSRG